MELNAQPRLGLPHAQSTPRSCHQHHTSKTASCALFSFVLLSPSTLPALQAVSAVQSPIDGEVSAWHGVDLLAPGRQNMSECLGNNSNEGFGSEQNFRMHHHPNRTGLPLPNQASRPVELDFREGLAKEKESRHSPWLPPNLPDLLQSLKLPLAMPCCCAVLPLPCQAALVPSASHNSRSGPGTYHFE